MRLQSIKNFLRRVNAGKAKKHDRGPLARRSRDSKYILSLALLLLIVSSVFHYGYYISILETKAPAELNSYPDLRVADLLKIDVRYKERKAAYADLVGKRPPSIDPN